MIAYPAHSLFYFICGIFYGFVYVLFTLKLNFRRHYSYCCLYVLLYEFAFLLSWET